MRRALVGGGIVAAASVSWMVGFATGPAPASQPPVQSEPYDTLLLSAPGGGHPCTMRKAGTGPMAHVVADGGCDALLSGLSQVRYWAEKPDGSVELSIDGDAAIVAFAAADGAGYESFEPRSSMISLTVGE